MEWKNGVIILLEKLDVEDFVAAGLEPGEINVTTDCHRVIPPGETWDETCQCHPFAGGPCGQKTVKWDGSVVYDDPEFKGDFFVDGVVVAYTPDEYEVGETVLVADGCRGCASLPAVEDADVCNCGDGCIAETGVVKRVIRSVNPPAPPKSREQQLQELLGEFAQKVIEIIK